MESRKSPSNRMNNPQVASTGRSFVESELRKRGAGCVTSTEGRKIYLRASSADRSRTIQIQVKAKTTATGRQRLMQRTTEKLRHT